VLVYGLSRDNDWIVVLSAVTIFGSLLVSYARSRAETLGVECKVGIMTRLERVVVTILMLLLNPLYPDVPILIGLGLMAVFTNVTVIMRIVYVRREMVRRGI
jgi:CDP-diacylglycerol--glycerol-3-phosphate 3-phosphatidyltransferase